MSAKDLVGRGSDTDCFHHLQELSSFAGSSAKDSKRYSRFWIRYYSKRFRFSFFSFYQSFPFLQSIPFLLTISIRGKKKRTIDLHCTQIRRYILITELNFTQQQRWLKNNNLYEHISLQPRSWYLYMFHYRLKHPDLMQWHMVGGGAQGRHGDLKSNAS